MLKRLKRIALKTVEYALILSLAGGLVSLLYAHSNRFRSLIVYGDSGLTIRSGSKLTNNGTSTLTGAITTGGDIISDTDGTDDLGSSSVAWLHVYSDTIVVNERLDPDADGGAQFGTSSLAFLQAFIDSLFAEHLEANDLISLKGDTSYIDGGAGVGGTASFTTTDLLDTVAFNSAAAVDGNSIFVVSFNTTTPDTNEVISWTAKADTLFVHRTAGATGATSGMTYSYIRVQ